MGFDSGSLSFQRYAVVGGAVAFPTEGELTKLQQHAMKPPELGVPEDVEWGWSGARHVLDSTFDFANCVFNDCIWFGLRIDTTTPPGDVARAYLRMEEEALAKGKASGFVSKAQRRTARDAVARKLDDERRAGKYRRSKMVPILWDVPAGIVYGPTSVASTEKLHEIFLRTFGLELLPVTSGRLALRYLETLGKRRVYEDFVPTRFVPSPCDSGAPAEYPWTARGDCTKDFLGNEFLLWLWYKGRSNGDGAIRTALGVVTVMIDRALQLDCVFNHTGKETLTAIGPTKMPEAMQALQQGKVPRKAGLLIEFASGMTILTLTGDSLAVTSLRLPDIDEADTPRVLFEERITLLRDFGKTLDALFVEFLNHRTDEWDLLVREMNAWISRAAGKDAT